MDATEAGPARAEIRAFLIADVRGYTTFTAERGDEAAARLASKFAAIARERVAEFGGEVIELRGDEALAVFVSPRQALRAAVGLQERLVDETEADPSIPLLVGVGVDAGEAVPVEGGWRGGALNLAARLCGQAGPGEILASREVTHLARAIDGVRYVDRGELHLKGLAQPVRAVRVMSEGPDPAIRLAPYRRPATPQRRRAASRSRRWIATGVAVSLVAAATFAIVWSRRGGSAGTSIGEDSAGAFDLDTGAFGGEVPTGARPGRIAAGLGSLWVTHTDDDTVTRIDPSARRVLETIRVGSSPVGVAVGGGAVWVANGGGRTVSRINPETNSVVQTITVGNGPTGVAVGDGAVWVTNSLDDTVARIDAASGAVIATIPVGGTPADVAVASGSAWVADSTTGQLSRIDLASNRVLATISVGNAPHAVAVSSEGVWVANTSDGTVSRIDPARDAVTATVTVGNGPDGLAVAGRSVWVTNEYSATVTRVDATSASTTSTIRVGNAPAGAAAVGGSLWVAVRGAPTTHRGGTLSIGSTKQAFPTSSDPARALASIAVPIVYDALVTYKRVGGVDGSTLVPDLATSLPTPTDGGLTYTFKLRRGITYADGTPLRAEDVRRSLERSFQVDPTFIPAALSGIVGTDECSRHAASCDLSDGVVESGDDALTIHLTDADPDFLYKLTTLYVVPSTVPRTDAGTDPIPGTGPYSVSEFAPGQHVTLVRNPMFHEWSRAAQPAGFPDRIEWSVVEDAGAGVDAVEAGHVDLFGWADDIPQDRLDEIFTRFTSQVRPWAFNGPWSMYLNTRERPFDDPRVRRALAYAIDRKAVQAAYPSRSTITCQSLPPNFPGYAPYCPYTVSPDAAGTWTAPDMTKARDLVAASGTKGMDITLWTFEPFAGASEPFADALNRLGYHAEVKAVGGDDFFGFYSFLADSSNHAQGGGFWVTSPDPAPSEIFGFAATCDAFLPNDPNNGNASELCDTHVDAKFAKAVRVQATDPASARQAWADLDRTVTDLSPWIPVLVPEGVDFLSERVSNYQHNPAIGVLLDQLWVT